MDARNRIARRYEKGLADVVIVPAVPAGLISVWAQYTIRVPAGRRDALTAALKAEGIPMPFITRSRCIASSCTDTVPSEKETCP